MLKKILSAFSFIFLSMFISATTLFLKATPALAVQKISDNSVENSVGIVIDDSNNVKDNSNTSVAPDLGDDQAFPFIPGFGKNSGKD